MNTAANLAGSEGIAIKIVDPTDGDTLHIVMPAAQRPAGCRGGAGGSGLAKVAEPQTIVTLFDRIESELTLRCNSVRSRDSC